MRMRSWLAIGCSFLLSGDALADPCGMVAPVALPAIDPTTVNPTVALSRAGPQKTYVFFKDGIETIVIRPGFSGRLSEFGMLVALPSPPAIRKVPEDVFAQIAAAIDPPEVIVDLRTSIFEGFAMAEAVDVPVSRPQETPLAFDTVRVIREEAIGLYEIAVLEAGSSVALQRWMEEHQFRFPVGMEAACDAYVKLRWAFVAVKARVARKAPSDPQPGMRSIPDLSLPEDSSFDGHVQAMAYRFRVTKPVVGMRLSTYNEADDRRQIVYVLADEPVAFEGAVESLVVRQVSGSKLLRNVDGPLPVRVFGGAASDLRSGQLEMLAQDRDPEPHNGAARDLFASDLEAAKTGKLTLAREEHAKALDRIAERLAIAGPEVEALGEAALAQADESRAHLELLRGMTLTVIDGEIPRWLLRERDLTFRRFVMPEHRNRPSRYHAGNLGALPDAGGVFLEDPDREVGRPKSRQWFRERWGH